MAIDDRMREKKEKEQREKQLKLAAAVGIAVVAVLVVYVVYRWQTQSSYAPVQQERSQYSTGVSASSPSGLTAQEEKTLRRLQSELPPLIATNMEFISKARSRIKGAINSGALAYATPQFQQGYSQAEQMLDRFERNLENLESIISQSGAGEIKRKLDAFKRQNGVTDNTFNVETLMKAAVSSANIEKREIEKQLRNINIHF